MNAFTARQMDHNNFMLFDGDVMVGLCDAQYVDLLMAAPDLLEALDLLMKSVSMAGTPMKGVDMRDVAAVVSNAMRKALGGRGAPGVGGGQ